MFRNTAHVYDILYQAAGKDYDAEATALHALVQERAPGAASLLDVACGTGGHLVHLRQWYDVVGVDVDPGMLDEAKRRLPEERFVEGDMRDIRLGRTFDAVCCLFSSVGYMSSAQELNQAVATMVSHCGPGAVFVMDGWVRPEAWRADPQISLVTASDETLTSRPHGPKSSRRRQDVPRDASHDRFRRWHRVSRRCARINTLRGRTVCGVDATCRPDSN